MNRPPLDRQGLSLISAPLAPIGGGSAFPHESQATGHGGHPASAGVSRLEWYAAQFIGPLIAATFAEYDQGPPNGLPEPDAVAAIAFDYAEAFLAEANRRHLNPKDTTQ